MGDTRQPGPIDSSFRHQSVQDGTMARRQSFVPGPSGKRDREVAMMQPIDKFITMLKLSVPLLPLELQQEFSALMSPQNLAIMAATLLLWAGSHAIGIGFIVDMLLAAGGVLLLGWQAWQAASDLLAAIQITNDARTYGELDKAAEHLAKFTCTVGVTVVSAILLHGGARIARAAARAAASRVAAGLGGMTRGHFSAFVEAAKETKLIIAVRNTNPMSTRWIEKGFPAKPMALKIKTSKLTGIVTATSETEAIEATKEGYLVIGKDLLARDLFGKTVPVPEIPGLKFEAGQVIDSKLLKPVVGDYDLLGVIDPNAPSRNLALAASNGEVLLDWTNPLMKRAAAAANRRLDQQRVMHGAHEAFSKGQPDFSDLKDGATVFYPDGTSETLATVDKIKEFYRAMSRQTVTGSHR